MADTTALKNRIRAAIKANDNQEITGPVLQQALLDMVDELNGATETEAQQRQSGDSTLQQGINTERQARIDADSALGQRITDEISQERQRAEEAFDDLDIIDTAGSQVSSEAIDLTLRKNDGSEADPELRTLCHLLIPSATNQRAGLMSAAMHNKLLTVLPSDIASVKDTYFDVTPEGNGYWSAGGVLTPINSYRYKSINVSNIAGKYILVKAGYPGVYPDTHYTGYSYIKKNDNSYVPLANCVIKNNIVPSNCSLIKLPNDALQLDISWDYNSGVRAIVSYSYLINSLMSDVSNIKSDISVLPTIKKRVGSFFNLSDAQSGYFSEGGTVSSHSDYKYKAFSLANYVGKTLLINAGAPGAIGKYCFVKFNDDTYKELLSDGSHLNIFFTPIGGLISFDVTSDMVELEISFSISAFPDVFVSTLTSKQFGRDLKNSVFPSFPFATSLVTFTKDVTAQYIEEGSEQTGYYDYKGILHGGDTNWNNVTLTLPANKWLRFRFVDHPHIACLIKKLSNKLSEVYYDINRPGNGHYVDYLFYSGPTGCTLIWSYSVQEGHRHYIFEEENEHQVAALQNTVNSLVPDVEAIKFKVITSDIPLIDPQNPNYPGNYWNTGGVLTPYPSYNAFIYNVQGADGLEIYVKAGFGIDARDKITGWSWLRKTDDSVIALQSLITRFVQNEYAVVKLPENSSELLISVDRNSWANHPEWGEPYVIAHNISDADKVSARVSILEANSLPLAGKKIFLFGDSISSTDYTWYKDYLALYTGATVYNQGASGRNAAYQASNEYFQRLANLPSDVIVVLCGGNDSGASGTIGTFDSNSELGQMGESVVQETDISIDYNGTKFIQAISHIIRKWRSLYWNFRLAAELNANILDTQNDNVVVYPSSGTATESECITYAESQGWTLGYNQRYVMKTTETEVSKREKLIGVKQPKMFICTTLPQRRYNSSSPYSNPQNWERKRLACIECAKKYGLPLIDLAKEFAIDWDAEPYWPGQGYSGTSKTDNQGIYTMDGLHPNEFGYAYISQIVSKRIIGDINV